jgi:TolA-binding protein
MTIRQRDRSLADLAGLHMRLDQVARWDREHSEQVIELRKLLDQASDLLAANSADVAARTARAEADITAMQARLDQMNDASKQGESQGEGEQARLEARVAALEQSEARIVERVIPPLPSDREQLWLQAAARFTADQTEEGRRFYRAFIQRFPADPRAPRAYLELGRSFALERRFSTAAAEFEKVLEGYPRSPEVPEAMWQLAMAFVHLHFCGDARALLKDLVQRYPKSSPVSGARKEIKVIKRLSNDNCTS